MAEPAETSRTITATVAQYKAVSANLGVDSASMLRGHNLRMADLALQPVFELSNSLLERAPVQLDEALLYLRDEKLCGLLLSLLRRWPWADMRHANPRVQHAVAQQGLALLPKVLGSLAAFLSAAAHVRDSQQASAYKEMSIRCLSRGSSLTELRPCPARKPHSQEVLSNDASCSACAYTAVNLSLHGIVPSQPSVRLL